jgi:hypothetical protein
MLGNLEHLNEQESREDFQTLVGVVGVEIRGWIDHDSQLPPSIGELVDRIQQVWQNRSTRNSFQEFLHEIEVDLPESVIDTMASFAGNSNPMITAENEAGEGLSMEVMELSESEPDIDFGSPYQQPVPEDENGPSVWEAGDSSVTKSEINDSSNQLGGIEDRLANVEKLLGDLDARLNRLQQQQETSVQTMLDYCEDR